MEDFAFGLKEKEIVNGVDTDPNDLTKVAEWTPSPFFVCKNQPDEVDLALFGDSINGNPTVNTIRFKQAGEWQLFVGKKIKKLI